MQASRMPDQCIFCAILEGKQAAYAFDREDESVSVLDIHPAVEGQSLIIPGVHAPLFLMLPPGVIGHVARLAQRASRALLSVLREKGVEGVTLLIPLGSAAGQRTPHTLVHLFPRRRGDGLFAYEREKGVDDRVYATARAVRETLARLASPPQNHEQGGGQ